MEKRIQDDQGNAVGSGLMSLGCLIMLLPLLFFLVILFFSMIGAMLGIGD
jgi:hypothetical protein